MEGGIAAMERLIALDELPTAVLVFNDMTAIGALHALYRTTDKVPADISVVVFDDIISLSLCCRRSQPCRCREGFLAAAAVEGLRAGIQLDYLPLPKKGVVYSHPAGGPPVLVVPAGQPAGAGEQRHGKARPNWPQYRPSTSAKCSALPPLSSLVEKGSPGFQPMNSARGYLVTLWG